MVAFFPMLDLFFRGGPVMYPLLLFSVIVLTVVIERTLFWITFSRKRRRTTADTMVILCGRGEWNEARRLGADSRGYLARILVSGIRNRPFTMTQAMESTAADEIRRMRRFLGVLDTMITAAPLTGILGTVLGIIASFEVLGSAGIANPKAVTAGIAQALITTAFGLGIAIVAIFPYNYFSGRVEKAVEEIEAYATRLEIAHENFLRDDRVVSARNHENISE